MVEDSKSDKDSKKVKKESDLKKFLKKRSFIYLMATVVFIVFFVPGMIEPSDLEKKLTENFESNEQKIAWDIIKLYKGADDEGSNLFDTIITQIENAYFNEKILKHNDTVLEISVQDIQEQKGVGFYEVNFTFQTYDDVRKYIWNVNIETEEIIPINDGARKMINIVEYYD
jgi:predicted RND superfamily exporter protein